MAIFLTKPLIDSLKPEEPQEPEVPDYGGQSYPSFSQAAPQPAPQLGAPMLEDYDVAPNVMPWTPPTPQQPRFYEPGGAVGDVFSSLGSAVNRGLSTIGQQQYIANVQVPQAQPQGFKEYVLPPVVDAYQRTKQAGLGAFSGDYGNLPLGSSEYDLVTFAQAPRVGALSNIPPSPQPDPSQNPLRLAKQGFMREQEFTPEGIVGVRDLPEGPAKRAAARAADIVIDPLNLVPVIGAIGKGARLALGLSAAGYALLPEAVRAAGGDETAQAWAGGIGAFVAPFSPAALRGVRGVARFGDESLSRALGLKGAALREAEGEVSYATRMAAERAALVPQTYEDAFTPITRGIDEVKKFRGYVDLTKRPLNEAVLPLSPSTVVKLTAKQADQYGFENPGGGPAFYMVKENGEVASFWKAPQMAQPNITRTGTDVLNIARGRAALVDRFDMEFRLGRIPEQTAAWGRAFIEALPESYINNLSSSFVQALRIGRGSDVGAVTAGRYDPMRMIVQISKEVLERTADPTRTIIHEIAHHLEQFVSPADAIKLTAQWERELAGKGRRALAAYNNAQDSFVSLAQSAKPGAAGIEGQIAEVISSRTADEIVDELSRLSRNAVLETSVFANNVTAALRNASETQMLAYRYTGFPEWFAENIADHFTSEILYRAPVGIWAKMVAVVKDFGQAAIQATRRIGGREDVIARVYNDIMDARYNPANVRDLSTGAAAEMRARGSLAQMVIPPGGAVPPATDAATTAAAKADARMPVLAKYEAALRADKSGPLSPSERTVRFSDMQPADAVEAIRQEVPSSGRVINAATSARDPKNLMGIDERGEVYLRSKGGGIVSKWDDATKKFVRSPVVKFDPNAYQPRITWKVGIEFPATALDKTWSQVAAQAEAAAPAAPAQVAARSTQQAIDDAIIRHTNAYNAYRDADIVTLEISQALDEATIARDEVFRAAGIEVPGTVRPRTGIVTPQVPPRAARAASSPGAVPPGGGGEIARPTLAERGLDKAKPKYGTRDVVFEDDIDKALYIVGNAMTKSKQHDRFMQFLRDATGGDNASIMAAAKARRAEIISMAKGSKTGDVIVRSSEPVAVAPEAVGGSGGGEPPVRPPAPPSEPDAVPPSDDAVPPQPAAATATPEQINQLTTFDFPKTLTSQMRANPILESGVAKSVAALQREIVYRTGGEGAETKAAGKSSQAAALFAAEQRTAGLPADEALRIRSASLSGKYMLPGEPAGLTEAETNAVAEYVRGAAKAETEDAAVFLRLNIERAFRTLVLGVERLQENQIEKLGMVFGSQFKATAKQVSEARLPRKTPLSAEQQAIVNEASDDAARQIATLEQQALAERETIADLSARASNLPNVTPTEKAIKARVEETIKKRVQTALKIENAAQKKAAAKQAKENPTIEQMLAQIEKGLAADPGATPASLEAVKYFLRHEMEYSASIPETTFPKAAAVRARIVGTVADRYLDRLLDQARVFVDAVQLSGVSEKTAKEVANLLTKASLKKRYGDVVPKRITDEVARANNAANVIVDGVAKLNQELKNVQFSLDLGVLGQQVNRAITSEAPIQTILGLIDQMLILAGKPMSFDSVTAGMTYAEKLMSYANSGLAINVSSGEVDLKAGYGLLNKIPGVGAGVEALTNLQYAVILQRLRVMIFESNLEILYRSGGDITSPSARATAAAFANAATSTSRPALIPGRAQLERALLLTNMRRAQITSLVQQLQTLDPRSYAAQRKLGVIAIINHWVINKAILAAVSAVAGATGSVIELDQSKKGYGSLTTKIKTAEGQNIVVPVSAQAQVEKAAARSVRELVQGNPQNVIPILEGLITSSASPFAGAALKGVLGWGFDSNRGMQVGTASRLTGDFGYGQTPMEKIFSSGLAPVPVIGQSVLLGKESFRTLPFSVTGFSAFPESGTAAVKRGDYKDRTGNAAFDTISPAAWKKLSPQFKQETDGFLNITDWRARAADDIKAEIVPSLGPYFLRNQLEDQIETKLKAKSPFYAAYAGTRDQDQIDWIEKYPEIALAKYDEGQQLIDANPGRSDISERAWKPSANVRNFLQTMQIDRGAPVGAR